MQRLQMKNLITIFLIICLTIMVGIPISWLFWIKDHWFAWSMPEIVMEGIAIAFMWIILFTIIIIVLKEHLKTNKT